MPTLQQKPKEGLRKRRHWKIEFGLIARHFGKLLIKLTLVFFSNIKTRNRKISR
jgi:hypothetical protein